MATDNAEIFDKFVDGMVLVTELMKKTAEKYKGLEKFFSASSAGHCYKKHLFKITDAPQKDIEARS